MTQLLINLRTVSQRDMQQRRPRDGGLWAPNGLAGNRNLKGKILIRPARVYVVSERELSKLSMRCLCTIVWHNTKRKGPTKGWRELKFIHKSCPDHKDVEKVYDVVG